SGESRDSSHPPVGRHCGDAHARRRICVHRAAKVAAQRTSGGLRGAGGARPAAHHWHLNGAESFPIAFNDGPHSRCGTIAAGNAHSGPKGERAVSGTTQLASAPPVWRRYLELTKPKVVALIVFTAIVGTLLASPGWPPFEALVWGNLGIALASACAATINHVLDRRIDEQMARTQARPLPTGQLTERKALIFAAVLGITAMAILSFLVNLLTAALTFLSLIGYAVIYTVWLKRATSQNIVIGGAAGAAPPVLGWAAVTNT